MRKSWATRITWWLTYNTSSKPPLRKKYFLKKLFRWSAILTNNPLQVRLRNSLDRPWNVKWGAALPWGNSWRSCQKTKRGTISDSCLHVLFQNQHNGIVQNFTLLSVIICSSLLAMWAWMALLWWIKWWTWPNSSSFWTLCTRRGRARHRRWETLSGSLTSLTSSTKSIRGHTHTKVSSSYLLCFLFLLKPKQGSPDLAILAYSD